MIILDERNFLQKELEEKGFKVFDFYENLTVLSMKEFAELDLKRRGEFLLIDTQTILNNPDLQEHFKSVMNTFLGAVFFHEHSNEKAQNWVRDEGSFLNKIIGEYSLPMAPLNWTILSNQLQFLWNLLEDQKKLQHHMAQFSLELDQVLQEAEVEMVRAKKIHNTIVPRRNEEVKGIVFTNKYGAGEGGGGEFYDLVSTPSKVYQVLFSSQSYLLSSSVMGILAEYREKGFNTEAFLKDIKDEIESLNVTKRKPFFDLLLLELDLSTLSLTQLSDSKAELYSQTKGQISLQKGSSVQLVKNEKVVVFSTGFLFNWNEGHPDKNLSEFLKLQGGNSTGELMSELFFQLKEGRESQFLKKDAIVVMMEVNKHGIHKI